MLEKSKLVNSPNLPLYGTWIYAGIVRQSGSIVKCYDEMCGDIMISDELRKMFLMDDSDNYEVYSEEDRTEFLFRIFKHICLGGSVCQVSLWQHIQYYDLFT